MAKASAKKTEANRLTNKPIPMRLDAKSQALVRRAAELTGIPISQFMRQHILEAARRTIEEQQVVRLSLEASQNFTAAISGPAKPNPKLARLLKRHQKIPFARPQESE